MTKAAVQPSIQTTRAAQENEACRLPAYFGISLGLCELKCLKTKPGVTVLSRQHDASRIHSVKVCGQGGQWETGWTILPKPRGYCIHQGIYLSR